MAATMAVRMVAMLIPGVVELKSMATSPAAASVPGTLVSTNSKVRVVPAPSVIWKVSPSSLAICRHMVGVDAADAGVDGPQRRVAVDRRDHGREHGVDGVGGGIEEHGHVAGRRPGCGRWYRRTRR